MANDAVIKIIIYSDVKNIIRYRDLENFDGIKIIARVSTIMELKGSLVLYKDAIVIVDEDVLDDKEEALVYIDNKENGCILCTSKFIGNDYKYKYTNVKYVYKNKLISQKNEFISNIVKSLNEISNKTKPAPILIVDSKDSKKIEEMRNVIDKEFSDQNEFSELEKYSRYSKVIAIGASTGGTEMVYKILRELPANLNLPIFVVQHMPEVFTKLYANRMNNGCEITVIEAKDGDPVRGRCAYVAPGGKQMIIEERANGCFIKILPEDPNYVNNPSVDVMFDSVSKVYGNKVVAVILTGMGKDGAKGLLNIKENGGYTIGQDENTSVVYGMPKAAFDIGAVKIQLSLDEIPLHIEQALKKL